MTHEEISQTLRRFLSQQLRAEIGDDAPIFGAGLANSLFAMQLVLFVEKQFGISIQNEDLELSNFETVGSIARLVAQKNGAAA